MDEQSLQEMYRLTKETNKMLHTMRRNAFWGGIIKWVFYLVVLVIAPLWFYNVYVQPLVGQFGVSPDFSNIQELMQAYQQ